MAPGGAGGGGYTHKVPQDLSGAPSGKACTQSLGPGSVFTWQAHSKTPLASPRPTISRPRWMLVVLTGTQQESQAVSFWGCLSSP